MNEVVEAYCIIHNMIAADRRYEGTMEFYNDREEFDAEDIMLQNALQMDSRWEQ